MKRLSRQLFVFPPGMVTMLYGTALGALIPGLQERFALSNAQAGLFSTMQSVGSVAAIVISFCLLSAMNKNRILLISIFSFSVCLIALGLNANVIVLYALFVFIGLFNAVSATMSNALMADGETGKSGFFVSILHGLWSGMAALGAFFVMIFNNDFTKSFVWLGALTLAALVIYTVGLRAEIRLPMMQSRSNIGSIGKLLRMFRFKGMAVLIAIGFISTIVRVGFTYFVAGYMDTIGGAALMGAVALGVLYLGMSIGRIVYANTAHLISPNKIMMISNICAMAAFTAMMAAANMTVIMVCMAIGALCFSINVPIIMAKAFEIVPSDTTGATALIFSSIVIGSFIGPPVIGAVGDLLGMRIALLLCVVSLVGVIVLAYRMLRREKLVKSSHADKLEI